jgi:hypothetical protein
VTALERKQQMLQEELTEARALVRQLRREKREPSAGLSDRLGVTTAPRSDAAETRTSFVQRQENIIGAKPETSQPGCPEYRLPLRVGDEVETYDGRVRGELVSVHNNRARIRNRSGVTFDVATTQVRKIS